MAKLLSREIGGTIRGSSARFSGGFGSRRGVGFEWEAGHGAQFGHMDDESPPPVAAGEDLAVRVVAILRHDGGPLRVRDLLTILKETGTSFISENLVYSVVGALKVARENGWVVKKGRGWWQAASQVP